MAACEIVPTSREARTLQRMMTARASALATVMMSIRDKSFWLAALLVAADPALAANQVISFVCCSYTPSSVSIAPGDQVTWNGAFGSHPLRQVDGPNSDTALPGGFFVNSGSTFSQTFNTPGTYYFLCTAHGQFGGTMRGSIIVASDQLLVNGFE